MAYKGKFRPKNPEKYKGDHTNIIWRSTWENKMMGWLDKNPSVILWSSEEIIIPYISPIDNRYHRYFMDFYAKMKTNTGIKTFLIEVKPLKQSQPPEKKSRITKRYIEEVATWGINSAKWKAATEYCKDRGWEFIVMASTDGIKFTTLTENDLMLS
jgi:hypothetical protein